ncbi:T-cell immunoreceptor with Ig and ITIM domains-like isoform X2 [Scyliorhinus canicula]|uniref:T-cell immunoreceptor with Ig and ITIM domains-like isoform X2 n=1 Tax=Scyliorhinus canicula TaxID=7830 RepID=UPI0018F5483D|nr:T-cell immunoreceptor with Ig and ITIM domains-like isoform X2 [Scyliorhinus canicula]
MIRTVVVYLLIVTGVQTINHITKENVTIVKGDSVTLRCDSSEENGTIVLVEWSKYRNKTKLAVCHSPSTHHFDQRIRMEVKDQHSTITIQETIQSDTGWYFCTFQTFPNGKQENQIYLDVKDANEYTEFSRLPVYVSSGVVLAVLAIGIIFILLRFVHQRKSRVNLPNQINIILKNPSDTDDQDNKQQLRRPMVTSSDGEDTGDNYMSV